MISLLACVFLFAALCSLAYLRGLRFGAQQGYERGLAEGETAGFVRGCDHVARESNAMLNAQLPAAIEAARCQGAQNCAALLLPLLARHNLELEAIELLAGKRNELAAKVRN